MKIIGKIILFLIFLATFLSSTDQKAINIKEANNNQFSFSLNMPTYTGFEVKSLTFQKVEAAPKPTPTSKPVRILSAATPKPKEIEYKIFEVTAYTNNVESTGKSKGDKGYGITASGNKTVEGVTISADWRVLPKGTRVYIEGIGERVVQDKGGAIKGNKIDLYFENVEDANNFGRKKLKVNIIKTEV